MLMHMPMHNSMSMSMSMPMPMYRPYDGAVIVFMVTHRYAADFDRPSVPCVLRAHPRASLFPLVQILAEIDLVHEEYRNVSVFLTEFGKDVCLTAPWLGDEANSAKDAA